MKTKIISILLIAFITLLLCKADSDIKEINKVTKANIVVGFSQMENNGPWRIAETNSIRDEAKKRNIDLIIRDAKGSVEKQIEDVKYLIEQNVDYILLAPKTYDGLTAALQLAKEAGIPVILIDRDAKGEPGIDYITLIASDFIWEAQMAAKLMVEATNGSANIVELAGTEGASAAIDRAKGFRDIIDKHEDMRIIESNSANFTRSDGRRVMEQIIQKYSGDITAIYAHNDEMAIGAIMALKAAGIEPGEEVTVISIDGESDALKAIIADDLYATIECSPYFGPIAFDVINRHMSGEEIETLIINEDRIFTKDNASEHIDTAF